MAFSFLSVFHILSQKGRHRLGQLVLRLPCGLLVGGEEQHQAQHVALAQDGRGHRGGEAAETLAGGHGLVAAVPQPDLAILHDLLQGLGDGLAQQLTLAHTRHSDDGVTVSDGGGELRAAAEGVAELGGKVLQPAQQGIFLENDLAILGRVNLQRVAFTDTHGAADLLGDHHAAQIVDAPDDSGCFHI